MTRYTLFAAVALAGCATVTPQATDPIVKTLNQLSNTAVDDLTTAQAVANAATPPAVDLARCAGAAIDVANRIQKLAAVTTGKTVGAFTITAIALIYAPGSEQYNDAVKTLETGCIAEAHDINGAAAQTSSEIIAGVAGALALHAVVP
jgi:hypothetical protein